MQNLPEMFFRQSFCRIAVVVGQVKMRDAAVKGAENNRFLLFQVFSSPKFCQNPRETAGSFTPLLPQRLYVMVSYRFSDA